MKKNTAVTDNGTTENNTAVAVVPAPVTAAVRQMSYVETAVQQAFEAEMAWRKAKKDATDAKAAERAAIAKSNRAEDNAIKTQGMSKVIEAQTAQAAQLSELMKLVATMAAAMTANAAK